MSGLASVFPPPPPYYKKYTEEAWNQCQASLKSKTPQESDGSKGSEDKETPNDYDITRELAPPAIPFEKDSEVKSYRNFGSIWSFNEQLPSLSESGIEQLYESGSEESAQTLVPELKNLLRGALLTYLGLVQALSSDPVKFGPRVERIRSIFINMHHLLNIYRPVQSKELLRLKMKDQIAEISISAASMREMNEKIGEKLAQLDARLPSLENLHSTPENAMQFRPFTSGHANSSFPKLSDRESERDAHIRQSVWKDLDLDADLRKADTDGAIE